MSSIASNDSRTASIAVADGWKRLPPEYAIPERAPTLAEAQEYCRRLARSHYENFSVATWFLPQRLRQHFFNVYAYCRISDDLGDEVGDPDASLEMLDQWEAELDACYAGYAAASGLCRARETVRKFDIPQTAFRRSADRLSSGPDRSRATRPSKICSATATIRRIRWDIWCFTSADIAMLNGRRFPISPAPRCNWRTSGRT